MTIDPDQLSFVKCPTVFADKRYEAIYQQTYDFWWTSWESVFRERGLGVLSSDLFTRQHFTGSLFYGPQCIGQICYRLVDLSQPATRQDSYFHNWTDGALQALTCEGSQVLVSSYLSVHPDYRGPRLWGTSVKDALIGFYSFLKEECHASGIAAAPRRDRNVNRTCRDWGGVLVEESVPSGYGDFVDLVVFQNNCATKAKEHPHYFFISHLWQNRLFINQEPKNKYLTLSA